MIGRLVFRSKRKLGRCWSIRTGEYLASVESNHSTHPANSRREGGGSQRRRL